MKFLIILTFIALVSTSCVSNYDEGESSSIRVNHKPVDESANPDSTNSDETSTDNTETTTETTTETDTTDTGTTVTAPTASLSSPADASIINSINNSATFAVTGTCDDATGSYKLIADSIEIATLSCDGSSLSGNFNSIALGDGSYSFTILATDSSGVHSSTSSVNSVSKDTQAPTASLTTPANASTIDSNNDSSTFAITGTCDDASATYKLHADATEVATLSCDGTNLTGSFDSTALANGSYDFTIAATDSASNGSTSSSNSVTKDTLAPSVSLTNPANASIINSSNDNSSFAVTGTCDDATGSYTLNADSTTVTTLSCDGASLTGTFDSTALSDGTYSFTVSASDSSGLNSSTSSSNTVTKDTLAPSATLTSPANASSINSSNDSSTFAVTGTCDDATATYKLNADATEVAILTCDGTNLTGTFNSTALANGSYSFSIAASDSASNNSTSAANTVTKDTTAPFASLTTPADASIINSSNDNSSFAVTGTCDDATGIYKLNANSTEVATLSCDGSSLTGSFDSTALGDGTYSFTISATDSSGQNSSTSSTNTVTKDTQAPTVVLSAPANASTINLNNNSSTFAVTGTCDDAASTYKLFADATELATLSCDGISLTGTFDTTALADGSYNFSVSATDSSLNVISSSANSVTVDKTAPNVSSVTANQSSNQVTGDTVSFTLSFDESVVISAGTRMSIQVGATSKFADCAATTGSSTTCSFVVASSDSDTDGIVVNSPIELNTGSITDIAGNNISGLTFSVPNTAAITVNTGAPEFQYENESSTIVTSHDFGTLTHPASGNHTFTITNTGTMPTTTSFSVTLPSGGGCNQFSIGTDNCSDEIISVNGTCTVELIYSAKRNNSSTHNCDVTTDDNGYTTNPGYIINLIGTSSR